MRFQYGTDLSPAPLPLPISNLPAPSMAHLAPIQPHFGVLDINNSPYGMTSNPSTNLTCTTSAGTATGTVTETVTATTTGQMQWSLTSDREYEYQGMDCKESIQDYTRKTLEKQRHSLTQNATTRNSLKTLKRDQEEMKREKQRQRDRRRRRRKRSDSRLRQRFEFKPTTNLHTIRYVDSVIIRSEIQ